MKLLLITLSLSFIYSCNSLKPIQDISKLNEYRVFSIEEVNNFYLIDLKNGDYTYRVLSKKENDSCDKKLKIGKKYKFALQSVWYTSFKLEGDTTVYTTPIGVKCKFFDENTEICLKEGENYIQDLFRIVDIKGLCVMK